MKLSDLHTKMTGSVATHKAKDEAARLAAEAAAASAKDQATDLANFAAAVQKHGKPVVDTSGVQPVVYTVAEGGGLITTEAVGMDADAVDPTS